MSISSRLALPLPAPRARVRRAIWQGVCLSLFGALGGCTRGITDSTTPPKLAGVYQYSATLPGPSGGGFWRGILVVEDAPGDSLLGTLVLPGQCLDASSRTIDCLGTVSGRQRGRTVSWQVTVPRLEQTGDVDPAGTWTGLWTMQADGRQWRGAFQAIPLH